MTRWHCPVCVTVFCVLCTYDKGYCFNFPLQNSQLRYELGLAGDQAELTLIYICSLSPSCATNYQLSTIPHLISTSPAPSFPPQPQLSHLKQFADRSRHPELDTCTGQWTVDTTPGGTPDSLLHAPCLPLPKLGNYFGFESRKLSTGTMTYCNICRMSLHEFV